MDLNLTDDRAICQKLLKSLTEILDNRPLRFMEVCGTHTVSIFQSGLRSLLPSNITHLSGPGCPVCVTHDAEIAACLNLVSLKDVIIATFGDLLRVPGPDGQSLKHARAQGGQIAIVYSPLEALTLAANNPAKTIVFLGIGFETTAPTVAATILKAKEASLSNFCVFSLHKLVPPVLRTLMDQAYTALDGFLLPGHVSTIIGLEPYAFLASQYHVPGVVGGFTAQEILLALCQLASAFVAQKPSITNAYPKAVANLGNPKARQLMAEVFEPRDALWRGLGQIPASGLGIRSQYAQFDAVQRFDLKLPKVPSIPGCKCGDVLKGVIAPKDCPLFGRKCTPQNPVGPCMVSTEGSCAAWFKYVGVEEHG
ncbi:MAG: hydrogenase formation protein HypD [Desulfovibrionaceae bacterium]|nr:hydrogenase formation protein HypD [Desulfovibrionaceae bacterium]